MGIEVTGKLHAIFETKQVSEKFTKRELVVEIADNPKYPQLVQFQLTGDRCSQLDEFSVGDLIRIEFSLRGREWRSPQGDVKYFNSLDVWKLEPARGHMAAQGSGPRNRPQGFDQSQSPRQSNAGFSQEMPAHLRDDVPRPDDDIPF